MEERDSRRRIHVYGAGFSSGSGRLQIGGRLVFGLALTTLGLLWTLDNLFGVDSDAIISWWPLLLVIFGVMKLTGIGAEKRLVPGAIFTSAGLLLLGNKLHLSWWHIGIGDLWPILLIFFGASVVLRSIREPEAETGDSDTFVRSFALMGGVTRRNRSDAFRGGDLSAMMGGVELDLRDAQLADGRAVVEVFAMWGGIEILVPPDWRVESEVTPIMAGYEDNTHLVPGVEPVGTLVVRGFAVMGGIEVANGKDDRETRVRVRRRDKSVEVTTSTGKKVSIGVTYPKHDDDQPRPVS
ncbi:MAG: hypothetical protein HZA61_02000 [Candidatus Eisenbacteria bacterium]|uniref:LiaF transmembrane domain-containing protein n=1 Tax=Eiseniibacteriota bacterium TaxID=2212470 RepID=A0A933W9C6_UNCEI|nr:hypothetical protein [Candidatus Eisenbacteria bacterium]